MLIVPGHPLRTGSLYRLCRHPNYVLNILPELIGLALAMEAWITLTVGLPIYLLVLRRRVALEEGAMEMCFPGYR